MIADNLPPSIQEIIRHKWECEWDDRLKAHLERLGRELECTWWDIVMDCRDILVEEADYQWDIND